MLQNRKREGYRVFQPVLTGFKNIYAGGYVMKILDYISKDALLRIIGAAVWVVFFIPTVILLVLGIMGELAMWIISLGFSIASGVVAVMETRKKQ